MECTIKIKSAGAALVDREDGWPEGHLSELIMDVGRLIADDVTSGTIRDYNGHPVGSWEYKRAE